MRAEVEVDPPRNALDLWRGPLRRLPPETIPLSRCEPLAREPATRRSLGHAPVSGLIHLPAADPGIRLTRPCKCRCRLVATDTGPILGV